MRPSGSLEAKRRQDSAPGRPSSLRPTVAQSLPWLARVLVPGLLLLLAAWLRLDRLWLVEYKHDEAVLTGRALSFVEGQSIPLVGNPSGAGVENPPGFVYLLSIPLRLWAHPLAGSAFLALLGSLAVVACYYLGYRYFGWRVGLAAGLLYAVNPWAAWFSRGIWEPDSVQLFAVLFFLALYAFVVEGRRWALALSIVGLAFLTQLHFQTVVLAPVWMVGIVLGRRWLSWRAIAVGLAASLLLYAPYLYGDAVRGWPSARALLAQPAASARVDLDALHMARELVARFEYFLPDDPAGGDSLAGARLFLLRSGEEILCLLGLASALWLALWGDRRRRAAHWLLLFWLAFPVLLSTRHWLSLYPHYFVTILPALCLAAGVGVDAPPRAVGRALALVVARATRGESRAVPLAAGHAAAVALGIGLWLGVLGVGYGQIYAWRSLYADVERGERGRYLYGVPLTYTSELASYLADQGFADLRVVAPSDDLSEALRTLLRHRASIARFDGRRALPLPPSGGAVYVVFEDGAPAAQLLARVAGEWRTRQVVERGKPVYSVYSVPGPVTEALLGSEYAPTDLRFEHGLRLIGARFPRSVQAGAEVEVAALWRVERVPTGPDHFVAFVHLTGASERELATADDYGHLPSSTDLGGDWVSWLTMRVPADVPLGAAWIDYGLYRSPGIRPVPAADAAGRSVGTHARLGPVKTVPAVRPELPPPQHALQARFGGAIALQGYDLARPRPGEVLVTLHWLALATPPASYQAFVHVVDGSGRLVAQRDSQPGDLPTALWDGGDAVLDARLVTLPAALPPGRYQLRAGLYTLPDGKRLAVTVGPTAGSAAVAEVVDDAVVLGEVSLP